MARKSGQEGGGGKKGKKVVKKEKANSDSEGEEEDNQDQEDVEDCEEADNSSSSSLKSNSPPRKIFIADKVIDKIGWENIEMLMLPHPKTGQKTAYLMDTRNPQSIPDLKSNSNFLFEIMTMEEDTRSWFVDDSVVSEGNIYVCTPMDPLFFVLPSLIKDKKAKPLSDHLCETFHNEKFVKLLTARLSDSAQLEHLTKKIVCDDIVAFKYLEDNTLAWLTEKAERTQKYLAEKDITGSEASVSSNFTKSSSAGIDEKKMQEYLRYGCEIIGEYIPVELKKQLFEKHGLPLVQEKSASKRKSEMNSDENENQSKKVKVGDDENGTGGQPTEDYGSATSANTVQTNAKVKTKDKELQKAAKGTQSLFKFFTPKAK